MKNLNVRKKILTLAMFTVIGLVSNPSISNAKENNEINIHDFDYIRDLLKASKEIDVKEKPNSSVSLGKLKKNETLKLLCQIDGYYEVLYNNQIGYVSDKDVEVIKEYPFEMGGYISKDCCLCDIGNREVITKFLKQLEFVKIYESKNDRYYVEVDGKYGFVLKSDVILLKDMYVVVDISSQNMKLYDDNKLLLETDVVTGQYNKNDTPLGIYAIGTDKKDISTHRYLVGPGYKTYVDYMMKFNGNIGFHDSEIEVKPNGFKHGWRKSDEYGKDTYLTNGSHGCVNMPNSAAEKLYEYVKPYVVDKGRQVKVLVKE